MTMARTTTLWSPTDLDQRVLEYTAGEDRIWDARLLVWDVLGSLGHRIALLIVFVGMAPQDLFLGQKAARVGPGAAISGRHIMVFQVADKAFQASTCLGKRHKRVLREPRPFPGSRVDQGLQRAW